VTFSQLKSTVPRQKITAAEKQKEIKPLTANLTGTMNPLTQSKYTTILPVLIALALGCFALSPTALAVTPAPDGGYPNQNTAQDDDALYSNTTGSDNALVSWMWRVTGRANILRNSHTATLLQNGMVLVAGGTDSHAHELASAELYDPASRTWTVTGSLNTARGRHTATLLQNGMVLLAGGQDINGFSLASAELYDPASGTWTTAGSLNTERWLHTATLLQNGMVLVAGGDGTDGRSLASAELGRRQP
jgi:hypothetical protein